MKRLIYILFGLQFGLASFGQGLEIVHTDTKSRYENKSYLVTNSLKLSEGFSINSTTASNGEFFAQSANDDEQRPFITRWKTTGGHTGNNKILIPAYGTVKNYTVDWIKSNDPTIRGADGPFTGGAIITFPFEGEYIVIIRGEFPQILFNDKFDKNKIISIEQWGDIKWESMGSAFYGCRNLTINALDSPDLSEVQNMNNMFYYSSFNQDIGHWNISNVTSMINIFTNSEMSNENYDKTINGWASQSALQYNVTVGADDLYYCNSDQSRQALVDDYEWDFIGDNLGCEMTTPFVTRWDTRNGDGEKSITIPIPEYWDCCNYRYQVSWKRIDDPSINGIVKGIRSQRPIYFPSHGIYELSILGIFPSMAFFSDSRDNNKLISVEQWGDNPWMSLQYFFKNCNNVVINATDAPNLTRTPSMHSMFENATSFNNNINHWDVSNIESMSNMFRGATAFNQNLNTWNVGNVKNMGYLFSYAENFNGDISDWNTENVSIFTHMFSGSSSFNQDVSNWDVSNAEHMSFMFKDASLFNQNLGNWNLENLDNSGNYELAGMLSGTNLSISNYDETLVGWATLDAGEAQIPTGIYLTAYGLEYCAAEYERASLINTYGWRIWGDELYCSGARLDDIVLGENEQDTQLVVYPNPADTYIQIVDDRLIGASVSIFDMNGKIVFQESNVNNTQMEIDIYHIPDGIYLVKVEKDGKISERKIIIQH